MRDEIYYYVDSGTCEEQEKWIKLTATELVKQAMDRGYIVESCFLAGQVLILDYLRTENILPKEIWAEREEELIADKLKAKKKYYHLGLSGAFLRSTDYLHWQHGRLPIVVTNDFEEVARTDSGSGQAPHLTVDRSGKASLLEHLMNKTEVRFAEIPLDDENVYRMMESAIEFEHHPYLPDGILFDMGVWGFPGIGTDLIIDALKESEPIHHFNDLVEVTRRAVSGFSDKKGEDITEAYLEALFGYHLAWYRLHYVEEWNEAYCRSYLNPEYLKEWEDEICDGDLVIEKYKKRYWEEVLIFAGASRQSYIRVGKMDIQPAITFLKETLEKEGPIVLEESGVSVLKDSYCDFWRWLCAEEAYQKDELLMQIACYAPDEETKRNKMMLFELASESGILTDAAIRHKFCTQKPEQSYTKRFRIVARRVERDKAERLNALKKYSNFFTKFSIQTESAEIFRAGTVEERAAYLRQMDYAELSKAFVLYYPSDRMRILDELTLRLQIEVLENMRYVSRAECFSLQKCVEAEEKIANLLKKSVSEEYSQQATGDETNEKIFV